MDQNISVFDLLARYDVVLPAQLVNLLKEVDVTSLRTIAQIDSPEEIRNLEEAIKESVSNVSRFQDDAEKASLLGAKFSSDPNKFKFSYGEKLAIKDAVKMAKKILESKEKEYNFEWSGKRKRTVQHSDQLVKRARVMRDDASTTSSSETGSCPSGESSPPTRKGKTLQQYLGNWFINTKMLTEKQIAYLVTDCEVMTDVNKIKCLKCQTTSNTQVDVNGSWKLSSFILHLEKYHRIVPEDSPRLSNCNTRSGSSNQSTASSTAETSSDTGSNAVPGKELSQSFQ